MGTQEFKRRLTAILSADVEGYSGLMSPGSNPWPTPGSAYRRPPLIKSLRSEGRRGMKVDFKIGTTWTVLDCMISKIRG